MWISFHGEGPVFHLLLHRKLLTGQNPQPEWMPLGGRTVCGIQRWEPLQPGMVISLHSAPRRFSRMACKATDGWYMAGVKKRNPLPSWGGGFLRFLVVRILKSRKHWAKLPNSNHFFYRLSEKKHRSLEKSHHSLCFRANQRPCSAAGLRTLPSKHPSYGKKGPNPRPAVSPPRKNASVAGGGAVVSRRGSRLPDGILSGHGRILC